MRCRAEVELCCDTSHDGSRPLRSRPVRHAGRRDGRPAWSREARCVSDTSGTASMGLAKANGHSRPIAILPHNEVRMVLHNPRERASVVEARQGPTELDGRPEVQTGGLVSCFHDDTVSVFIAMRANSRATRSRSEVGDVRQLPPCLSIPGLFVHQQAHVEHERARKREFPGVEGHCRWARRGRACRSGRRTRCRTGSAKTPPSAVCPGLARWGSPPTPGEARSGRSRCADRGRCKPGRRRNAWRAVRWAQDIRYVEVSHVAWGWDTRRAAATGFPRPVDWRGVGLSIRAGRTMYGFGLTCAGGR